MVILSPLTALVSLPFLSFVRLLTTDDDMQNLSALFFVFACFFISLAVVFYRLGFSVNGTSTPVSLKMPVICQAVGYLFCLGAAALFRYLFFAAPAVAYFGDVLYGQADDAPKSVLFFLAVLFFGLCAAVSFAAYLAGRHRAEHDPATIRLRMEKSAEDAEKVGVCGDDRKRREREKSPYGRDL